MCKWDKINCHKWTSLTQMKQNSTTKHSSDPLHTPITHKQIQQCNSNAEKWFYFIRLRTAVNILID